MQYRVISADNHVNEPPGTFVDRVPKHLKDRAPQLVRHSDGGDGWSLDGRPPTHSFGLSATGGLTKRDHEHYRPSGLRWEEIPMGNYDGAACIKDNEVDGVDAASIYPYIIRNAYRLKDREVALACVRAYNDWLIDDFCSADPNRLLSLGFVPIDDGEAIMVAEAERVITKGAKGLFLTLPQVDGYHHPRYDPLWKVATEAGVAVTTHRSGVSIAAQPPAYNFGDADNAMMVANVAQRFFVAIDPISYMIFSGVFDRFPSLIFVAAEVNCNWIPALAQQMDQEYERQRHWAKLHLDSMPSQYFGKNVLVTMLDDYAGVGMIKDYPYVADTTMFSSDYPHSVTLWPHSQEAIAKMTTGLSDEVSHKILAGNAMRVFSLTEF